MKTLKKFATITLASSLSLIFSGQLFASELEEDFNIQDIVNNAENAQENLDSYYMVLDHHNADAQVEEWVEVIDDTKKY